MLCALCVRTSYFFTGSLDGIIASDTTLETLGDRFALTEGPVWVPEGADGYLLFSDNAANVIYKWARNRPLSVFLEKSGHNETDVANVGAQTIAGRVAILLIGWNGLALDPQGRLVVTRSDRTVYRLEKDGTPTILADRKGHLYSSGGGTPGRIQITSPDGKPLGRLHLPQLGGEPRSRVCATNLAFGDADDRGLYITACTHVFKIRVKTPGVRPGQKR